MIIRIDGEHAERALAEIVSAAEWAALNVTIERASEAFVEHTEKYTSEFTPLYDGTGTPEGGTV